MARAASLREVQAPPPAKAKAEPPQTSVADIEGALWALDRALGQSDQRKRLAQLGRLLNGLGQQQHESALAACRKKHTPEKLLSILETNLDPDDEDAVIELAHSSLGCLASVAYIGGVREIQDIGGTPALVSLMKADDTTLRAYAAACMQNMTAFMERVDLEQMQDAVPALKRLADSRDASIAGPAKLVLANIEQVALSQSVVVVVVLLLIRPPFPDMAGGSLSERQPRQEETRGVAARRGAI